MNSTQSGLKIRDSILADNNVLRLSQATRGNCGREHLRLDKDTDLRDYLIYGFTTAGTNFTEGLTLILEYVTCSVQTWESRVLRFCSTNEKIELLRKALTSQKLITADQQQFTRLLDEYSKVEILREQMIRKFDFQDNEAHVENISYLTFIMENAFQNLESAISAAFNGYTSTASCPFRWKIDKVLDLVTFADLNEQYREKERLSKTK